MNALNEVDFMKEEARAGVDIPSDSSSSTSTTCEEEESPSEEFTPSPPQGGSMKKKAQRRDSKLQWGTLEVRTFRSVPGDHPDCISGPPVTIDWDHWEEFSICLDEFEEKRQPRRSLAELKLGWEERRRLLGVAGHKPKEITQAWTQSKLARNRRLETLRKLKYEQVDIFLQSLQRKMGRLLCSSKPILETKY